MLTIGKYKVNSYFVYTLLICWVSSVGCSHFRTLENPSWKRITTKEPLALSLKPLQGRLDKSHHYSHSQVATTKNGEKPEIKNEVVEFDISTELLLVDRGKAHLHYLISTLMKKELQGKVDLSDLAFPENGKSLNTIYYPNGSVVKVEGKSKQGIYYVPPISLPLKKVKVGETWDLTHLWITEKDKLPLKLSLTSIFKELYSCPTKDNKPRRCAEIELSGAIEILGLNETQVSFTSKIEGRLVFHIDHGAVLWSEVFSEENLKGTKSNVKINSCMSSALYEPIDEALTTKKVFCDPLKRKKLSTRKSLGL